MPDVPSALPKAEAARLRGAAYYMAPEPEEPLEDRLWSALDRAVGLLEAKLAALEASDVPAYVGDATGEAEAVRNIAETLARLGMLKPPPPPVEASGPDVSEVWIGRIEEEEAA